MEIITISIPHEMKVRLSKESNKSGLIYSLLVKHFKEFDVDIKDLESKKDELIKINEEAIKEIEKQKEEIISKEIEEKQIQIKQETKQEEIRKSIELNLNDLLERRATDEEINDYLNKYEQAGISMWEYVQEIKSKEM